MQQPGASLAKLPGEWLDTILDAAAARHQTVDNIVRRSAGAPFAVTAILLAEQSGTQKVMIITDSTTLEIVGVIEGVYNQRYLSETRGVVVRIDFGRVRAVGSTDWFSVSKGRSWKGRDYHLGA